jgi:EamA domain-containing membrane protein RarD
MNTGIEQVYATAAFLCWGCSAVFPRHRRSAANGILAHRMLWSLAFW